MKLIDNLYCVTSQLLLKEEHKFVFSIVLRADHIIYKAHFPGTPITPGVCMIQIVQELLSKTIGRSIVITSIRNAKYITPLVPVVNHDIDVEINNIPDEDLSDIHVSAIFRKNKIIFSKMNLYLRCVD